MFEDSFEIKEVLLRGWQMFRKDIKPFIALSAMFIFGNILIGFLKFLPLNINFLLGLIINGYLILCFTKAALAAMDGKRITIDVLKTNILMIAQFAAVSFLFFVGVFLGQHFGTALVFLTFAASALFIPLPFLMIDKKLFIIPAVKESIQMSLKNFISLLLFSLIAFTILFCGAALALVGLAAALPIVVLACAAVYRSISQAPHTSR